MVIFPARVKDNVKYFRTILESIDSVFNATMSYRTDSDVTRHFGDAESIISQIRFDSEGKLKMSDEQYAKELIEKKFEYGSDYNTAWYVSNCNFTSGAEKRYEFGKKMIEKGLKLYSEGGLLFLNMFRKGDQ